MDENFKKALQEKLIHLVKKPAIKYSIFFFLVLICIYGGLIGFLLSIDPNLYKEKISTAVSTHIGEEMEVNGPLQIQCFPRIALVMQDLIIHKHINKRKRESIKIQSLKIIPRILPLIIKNFSFKIEINSIKFRSYLIPELSTRISIKNNIILLKNLSVRLHDAVENVLNILSIEKFQADVSQDIPKYYIKCTKNNFPLSSISDLLKGNFKITGDTVINMELTAIGTSLLQIQRSLTGTIEVEIAKGKMHGVDLISSLDEAKSLLETMSSKVTHTISDALNAITHHKKIQNGGITPFTKIVAKAKLENGFIYVQNLHIKHHLYDIKSVGKSHLVNNSLDYQVEAVYKKRAGWKQRKKTNAHAAPLIIHVTGTMDNPKIKPDFSSYLKYIHQS